MSEARPFAIPKQLVWDAYQRVKANGGAAGVDGVSLAAFETDLKNNLYKVWNRMASGSYHPPPVRLVEIPKATGGTRPLGIPTVADRVAQTAVTMDLEPLVEPHFHLTPMGIAPAGPRWTRWRRRRKRCWRTDWVIDLDIKAFLIPCRVTWSSGRGPRHGPRLGEAVRRAVAARRRASDGTLKKRTKGTPQGAWSTATGQPLPHDAFHRWMARDLESGNPPSQRYADDALVHCGARRRQRSVLEAIRGRLAESGLELHPAKTRIVYCKDDTGRVRTNTSRSTSSATPSNRDGPRTGGSILRQLPAGDQHQGREGDPGDDP